MIGRPKLGTFGKRLLIVGSAVVVALGAAVYVIYPQILKAEPTASYPRPRNTAEANLQDIDFLGRLIEVDRSFTPEARAAFSAGIADLKGRAGELSPTQLEMEAARLVALADNGHTNVKGVSRGLTLNALPVRINRFAEGYFVTRARPEHADLLGARIEAINGQTPEALVAALAPYTGGPPSFRREAATSILLSPAALAAAGFGENDDRASLTMTLATGEEITRELVAEAEPASGPASSDPDLQGLRRRHWPQRNLSPVPSPVDVGAWQSLLDPRGPLPLYLRQPDVAYWSEEIPELDAIYVQINVVIDAASGPTLKEFLNGRVARLKEDPVRNVIVDLRFNPGGNGTLTADFTSQLPDTLPEDGRIFILTSGNTYSAAIITVARLAYFGGERALVVGEAVGDREQFWAEGGTITLPNSGLQVGYATAAHDWEHRCRLSDFRTCYFINYIIGVPAGKLTPDLPVEPRFADYLRGEDSLLAAIAARLEA